MNTNPPFYVGLCMAGAVSAGAYTAGVMDYLIEALDEWEKRRGQPGVPDHRVVIPVMGGASAGGMTSIITASAINNPIVPVKRMDGDLFRQQPQNKFYHSWVDLVADDMVPLMLDTSDIQKGKILSLLNSSFINSIAQRAIQSDPNQWVNRPYIAEQLKVFVTLSSLRGFWFDISFRSRGKNPDLYYINKHNDYACFQLNTPVYKNDGWIPLDFRTGMATDIARDAAMATGAFPVGLQARTLSRDGQQVNDNPWLKVITDINPVPQGAFDTLNVDGGMINNEPFEKVRDVLISITGQTNPYDYHNFNTFTSTVLMIDPFPSLPPEYDPNDHLFSVVGSTLGTLIDQVRIKPETLVDAMDSNLAGQYLIAPSRQVPQIDGSEAHEELGAKAIACGSFSGFGGFFHKEFRIHDYFLGRANCEKFLRDHFTVPADSTNLITAGYTSLSEEEKKQFRSNTDEGRTYPIIPIFAPRTQGKYLPTFSSGTNWPVQNKKFIDNYEGKVRKRVDALIMNLSNYKPLTKFLVKIGAWVVLNRKLARVALDSVKESLTGHQLLK